MITVLEYLDAQGRSPFRRWFARLDAHAAAKVSTALYRLSQGNLASLKSIGGGAMELRIDFGPGYRVYLGRDGSSLVILLGGGTKRRQSEDISAALAAWRDYQSRRRGGPAPPGGIDGPDA